MTSTPGASALTARSPPHPATSPAAPAPTHSTRPSPGLLLLRLRLRRGRRRAAGIRQPPAGDGELPRQQRGKQRRRAGGGAPAAALHMAFMAPVLWLSGLLHARLSGLHVVMHVH